jgi:hypothetical protein
MATTKNKPKSRVIRSAFKDRNWEVLFVTLVFFLSLVFTVIMVLVSVSEDVFRIIPAAALLAMVELWLLLSVPFYSKISFWGGIIFIATFLFFAVPAVVLNFLPTSWTLVMWAFIVVSVICFVIMFRQRAHFLPPPPPPPSRKTAGHNGKP